jgi:tetratricopeptide (TPR) repeat protein
VTSGMVKLSRGLAIGALLAAAACPVRAQGPMAAPTFVALLQQANERSAAKDWAGAIPLWERVVAANPVEGRFWNALATARYRARDYRGAIPAYEKAVELGFGAPENNVYNIACAYALLGDKDRAFAALSRALAMGFEDLGALRTDPDLAALRGDARFARLVPLPAVPAATRIEGWRTDLRFLLWQIDRLGADPYRRKPRSWFDRQFEALVASAPSRSDAQMAFALAAIMRELGDGHSGVMHGATPEWALSLPLQFTAFEDGVYITAADPKYRDLLGARLLAIGGKPVEQLMAAAAETVSRDNEGPWVQLQAASRLRYTALFAAAGLIADGAAPTLRVRNLQGAERSLVVAADTTHPDIWNQKPNPPEWASLADALPGPAPLSWRDPGKNYWFDYLPPERTVFLAFNTVRDDKAETLAAFATRLAKFIGEHDVDRLIVDMRWNNGGNTQLATPLLAAIIASEKVNRRGRLFVIVGRRTFSAAQNAATLIERFTNATFVGEPTGSSPNFIGEEQPFVLPYSKLVVNVSRLRWQSGYPQDHRTWIAPLLYVAPTFADYRAKRDSALDAILALPLPD